MLILDHGLQEMEIVAAMGVIVVKGSLGTFVNAGPAGSVGMLLWVSFSCKVCIFSGLIGIFAMYIRMYTCRVYCHSVNSHSVNIAFV